MSADEDRILLTRDRGLLKRSIVRHGYLVRDDDPRRQLAEVVGRYGLAQRAAPFSRCVRCNGAIEPVDGRKWPSAWPASLAPSDPSTRSAVAPTAARSTGPARTSNA